MEVWPQLIDAGDGEGVCVGDPLPGVQVQVSPLDHDGTANGALTEAPGVTGEICVRADHVRDRYDALWATSRAASRDPGWHRTGDVGHRDQTGRLWVQGRLVHVVTTAEGPVTPVGVEQRVERLDEVDAAAVVGVGPVGGQGLLDAGLDLTAALWDEAEPEFGWQGGMDRYIIHQVSQVHTNALCQRLGIDPGRVPRTFPTRGNIGPASIPTTLAKEVEHLEGGDRVLLMGIGSGLNASCVELTW